jgi:hypothetical protein
VTTVANVRIQENGHWYFTSGEPCFEVAKADGKGMTKTTLRHAKKMNLLPSVTTILKILDKPALTAWKIEQAVLAIMTTPRLPAEADDAFTQRVLAVDKEQDQERDAAAQLGTDIHAAIEARIKGQEIEERLIPYVMPVMAELLIFGSPVFSEKCLVGKGYAGRCDLCASDGIGSTIIDFKSTKKLPRESYIEHRMQLAAYAKCEGVNVSRTANIYISTVEPGKISVCENVDIEPTFEAFNHLLKAWQWMSNYTPKQ